MSSPFKIINDIYEDGVKEFDQKQTSELYKSTFLKIKDEVSRQGIIFTDIKYLDGYFVFGMGTNSVVHFKVKGNKNWQWGMWFNYDENAKSYQLSVDIFCQHERYLDKFKPSRGTYCYRITMDVKEGMVVNQVDWFNLGQFVKCCQFIHKNPYIAAMKDFYDYDYNVTKQRPVAAFFTYYWDLIKNKYTKVIENLCNKRMVRELKKYAEINFPEGSMIICEGEPMHIVDWEINDAGDHCSPRYELQVKIKDTDVFESGCYSLFDDDQVEEKEHWNKLSKRLNKIAKIFGVYWDNYDVSDFIIFWKQKEFDEYHCEE